MSEMTCFVSGGT